MQKYRFPVVIMTILLISSLLLTGCTKKEEEVKNDDANIVIDQEDNANPDSDVEEEIVEEEENTEEEEVVEEEESGDFSKFTNERQEVGSLGNDEYRLERITDTKMSGFHRIVFTVSAKDDGNNLPNLIAAYRADSGVVRVTLNMVTTDQSGIQYQKSREINEEGVLRIYHNVSSNQEEELYDIGVAKSTTFLLSSEEVSDGKWNVTLDVRYPGESDVDVDMGSTDFSQDKQEIIGAVSSDGAKVSSYSYGASGGVLSFVWAVKGSDSKLIPTVFAEYISDTELVVTFPDLTSDVIAGTPSALSLYGGVEKVVWTRSGKESKYTFNVAEKKDFKLRSSLSPNQVVLEIEL